MNLIMMVMSFILITNIRSAFESLIHKFIVNNQVFYKDQKSITNDFDALMMRLDKFSMLMPRTIGSIEKIIKNSINNQKKDVSNVSKASN